MREVGTIAHADSIHLFAASSASRRRKAESTPPADAKTPHQCRNWNEESRIKSFDNVTYDPRCVDADAKESLDGLNHGQRGANLLPNLVSKQHMGESSHVFLKLYGDSAIAWH